MHGRRARLYRYDCHGRPDRCWLRIVGIERSSEVGRSVLPEWLGLAGWRRASPLQMLTCWSSASSNVRDGRLGRTRLRGASTVMPAVPRLVVIASIVFPGSSCAFARRWASREEVFGGACARTAAP